MQPEADTSPFIHDSLLGHVPRPQALSVFREEGSDISAIWHALPIARQRAVVRELMTIRIGHTQAGNHAFRPADVKVTWRKI